MAGPSAAGETPAARVSRALAAGTPGTGHCRRELAIVTFFNGLATSPCRSKKTEPASGA